MHHVNAKKFLVFGIVFLWPYTLPFSIAPTDVLLLSLIIYQATSTKMTATNFFLLILLPITFLLLSDFHSATHTVTSSINQILFYPKYILLFGILTIFTTRISEGSNRIDKHIIITTIIFCIITVFEWQSNFDTSFRAGFPGTARFTNTSDAHLLSASASLLFIAILELSARSKIVTVALALLLLVIVLTGSRTGIITLIIYFVIISPKKILYCAKSYGHYLGIIAIIGYNYIFLIYETLSQTIDRISNINITNDFSTMNRLTKIIGAFRETEQKMFLIGNGPIHAQNYWYDNTYAMWVSHFGLAGAILISAIICVTIKIYKPVTTPIAITITIQALSSDYIMTSKYQALVLVICLWSLANKTRMTGRPQCAAAN